MIEHLKSGLSISTHSGCTLKCSYCVLSMIKEFENGPVLNCEPKELVSKMLNYKYYRRDITPIVVNNRTEPFLHRIAKYTLEVLEELVKNEIKSPVIIISKLPPHENLKKYFNKLNIIFIYSYSNIETDFNYKRLESDLKTISTIIPKESRYHYYRPIIPGVNDEKDEIIRVLKKFKDNDFSGSILTGLRITEANKTLIQNNEVSIDNHDLNHKFIRKDLNYLEMCYNEFTDYKILRHTTCAIASFFNRPTKLKYFGLNGHCSGYCDNYEICKNEIIDIKQINKEILDKYAVETVIDNDSIEILNKIDQEFLAYLKNIYGVKIKASRINLCASERKIINEK